MCEGIIPKHVINRAEETDSLIFVVHNHPSGNTEASKSDDQVTKVFKKCCRRSDGLQRYAGHIILDHDNFNLYSLHGGWNDDFIPVVFTNADRKINALQYFHISQFNEDSACLKNKLKFAALESGSISAFPVITDDCIKNCIEKK